MASLDGLRVALCRRESGRVPSSPNLGTSRLTALPIVVRGKTRNTTES
jgi:hypothetical protein